MELTGRPDRRPWNGDFETLPAGYCFKPSAEELITAYLIPTIDGTEVPPSIIKHIKLYQHNPYELQETMNRIPNNKYEAWYFFTPVMRKYKNSDRPNRTVPGGYWKATGKEKSIKDGNNTVIGAKRALVFYKGEQPNGVKTDYIMHEFRETNRPRRPRSDDADDMLLDECVLSRIYKKSEDEEGLETEEDNRDAVGEIAIHRDYLASNLPYHYPTDPTAEIATEVNNYNSVWIEIEAMLRESLAALANGNGITRDQDSQNPTVDSNVALQDSSAGITRARYLGMHSNWYQRDSFATAVTSGHLFQYPLPFATAVPPPRQLMVQYTTIEIAETAAPSHQHSQDPAPSHQHSQYPTVGTRRVLLDRR